LRPAESLAPQCQVGRLGALYMRVRIMKYLSIQGFSSHVTSALPHNAPQVP
jgi:hypothetical protein